MQPIQQGHHMAEPISGAAGAAFGWKAAGFGALIGSGILGGLIMAVFDPPKSRGLLALQGAAAGIGSLFFAPICVRAIDHYVDWLNLSTASSVEVLETAAPIYLLVGCLSWGVFGALAKLREIIRDRGAAKLAEKAGITS